MISLEEARAAPGPRSECAIPSCHETSVRCSLCELHDFTTRTGRALPAARWCAAWLARDRNGRIVQPSWRVWCATADGHQHADTTNDVPVLCGHYVLLPAGSEYRVPTCHECLDELTKVAA